MCACFRTSPIIITERVRQSKGGMTGPKFRKLLVVLAKALAASVHNTMFGTRPTDLENILPKVSASYIPCNLI